MPSQAGDGTMDTENHTGNKERKEPNEDTEKMLRNLINESKNKPPEKRKRTISNSERESDYDTLNMEKNPSSKPRTNTDKNDNQKRITWNYELNDIGPYIVIIKKKERSTRPNSVLHICNMMRKLNYNYKSVFNENKWTTKIILETRQIANYLLNDQRVSTKYGYRAFLTQELLFRKIVVRDIPTDITTDELKTELYIDQGKIIIQDIFRLQRRNQKKELVPTESICVTLRSRDLPYDVSMWNAKLSFQPYVQGIRQCFKCGKLDHSTKFCKAVEAICLKCGNTLHGDCQEILKCINCGGPHKSLDFSCTKVQEAKEINKIRAYDNVSYFEAKNTLKKYQQTLVVPLKTKETFPSLKTKINDKKNINYRSTLIADNKSQWKEPINMVNNIKDKITTNNDKIDIKEQMIELSDAMNIVPNAELLMSRLWKTLTQHIKLIECEEENKKREEESLKLQNNMNNIEMTTTNKTTYQINSPSTETYNNKTHPSINSKPTITNIKICKPYHKKNNNNVNKPQPKPSEIDAMELPESDE